MPTLNWIGKEKVINHHQDVPYKILEPQYTFGLDNKTGNASENKIIHGDNLEALKSLLPEYEGKIKCIYIDPPYNTGNEGWVYNDNVNHPKLKKWLGQIVGKESEDLSRHDKWLCMMYPRLKLLHKLLADDGVIFISIDGIEHSHLKLLCDEIFGTTNFQTSFIWKSRQIVDSRNQSMISNDHEYILTYSKNSSLFKLRGKTSDKSKYKNPDDDPRGPWMSNSILGLANAEQRPNLHYSIVDPKTGIEYTCPPTTGWRYSRETMQHKIDEERIFFPSKKNGRPREKKFLNELASAYTGFSSLLSEAVGYTLNGTRTLRDVIPDNKFTFPKPPSLIFELIQQYPNDDDIILDSFAGSGTTAHAVLNLNKQDGGNRKFILVEMEDYANTITAERVKRVINGYGEDKKAVEGTGGDFTYYELGQSLFLDNGFLNEEVGLPKILEYVWYTETKEPFVAQKENYLLGAKNDTAYYFYYQKDSLTTLDESFLRAIKTKASQYIIYADNCLLDQAIMDKYNIVFKKIPRDITRF